MCARAPSQVLAGTDLGNGFWSSTPFMFQHCRYLRDHFRLRRLLVRGRGVFGSCSSEVAALPGLPLHGLLWSIAHGSFSWSSGFFTLHGRSKEFELSPPSVLTQCVSQSLAVTSSWSPHGMLSRPTHFKTATPILLLLSAHRLSATSEGERYVRTRSVFLPTVS